MKSQRTYPNTPGFRPLFARLSVVAATVLLLQTFVNNASATIPVTQIGTLSAGAPENMGKALGPMNYVDVETYRLAKAKLIWINWDYLEAKGFDVGDRIVTPEIEKAVLDAFAYAVPGKNESPTLFTKMKKIFKADIYGGDGLSGNMGSGRAASAGKIQSKGIGRTSLVTTNDPTHSNGVMSLDESIREAIYGEVGQMMPLGANRVIAIIDRGTTTKHESEVSQDTITIREDPLRPAHYMKNLWGGGPLMANEERRTADALKNFFVGFPTPAEFANASLAERTRAAVLAYGSRVAEQYAASFARKFYHGATSPSNIESSGRMIDYGTATTVPGYGKIKIIEINDHVGETKEFKEILMLEVLRNFRDNMPPEMASGLPTDDEMVQHFDHEYSMYLNREYLRLVGLSASDIIKIESLPEAQELSKILDHVARAGTKEVLDPQNSKAITKYNLNLILTKLAAAQSLKASTLELILKAEMPEKKDAALRKKLISSYIAVISKVPQKERIDLAPTAQARNIEQPQAYRWKLWKESKILAQMYIKNRSPYPIITTIDSVVNTTRERSRPFGVCAAAFR